MIHFFEDVSDKDKTGNFLHAHTQGESVVSVEWLQGNHQNGMETPVLIIRINPKSRGTTKSVVYWDKSKNR